MASVQRHTQPGRIRLRIAAAALIAAATSLAANATPAAAQNLVVHGCNERLPGEVGVGELIGAVGQTISVPITVNTTATVEAFIVNVDLPPGVLSYVRTDPGDLTTGFGQLGGNYFPGTNQVRIVGLDNSGSAIPSGVIGTLAVVVLQVMAPGSAVFGTSQLQDDLATYISCEDVHGTSATEPLSWGRTKAAYR